MSPTPSDRSRADAVAWLVGQLFWERILADLHRGDDAVDVEAVAPRRAA